MKRFVTILLCVLCVVSIGIAASAEEPGFTYYMSESAGGICVSGIAGKKAPETLIIPSEINGEKVVAVRNEVASDNQGSVRFDPVDLKGAKNLVISEGIERIEVFTGTENLESVVLPKSVRVIPGFGFAGAKKLKRINLEWVESISSFAFEGCESLKEVKLLNATKVGTNSFNLIDSLTIYGMEDSAAKSYATKNSIDFVKVSDSERKAHKLYILGLMKGTGVNENGILLFDLDRTPTRAEAVTMLVRFLGKEEQAEKSGKTHSFTDVPLWTDGYVSYAYNNGLTNGISETKFGADTPATPEMYLTFILRASGYSDSGENKDFSYEDPWEFAMKTGITPKQQNLSPFYRSEMVDMSYNALFLTIKNTEQKMHEKMIASGVFSQKLWDEIQDIP